MTFTTSANLIGLACVGTATSSKRLETMLKWRKIRLLIWLGNSLLKSLAAFVSGAGSKIPLILRHSEAACCGYKPFVTQMGLFSCKEKRLNVEAIPVSGKDLRRKDR